ncbi:MAG TPA: aminotransferase class IV [Candidatus Saccharimonadales bacterium]|nr:aminotransferase class IV [Candidatus Saccharimonadales bacterium]
MHYLNGHWVEEKDLVIPVRDLSVIRGFGAFDFLRTYSNYPFKIDEHIDRFYKTSEYLNLKIPCSPDELKAIILKGIELNKAYDDQEIRMILTGGVSQDFITPSNSSLIVTFYQAESLPNEYYEKGVSVETTPHIRHLPEAKSLNYLTAVLARQEAAKSGAFEVVYVDPNSTRIYEATTCNIFVVENGIVKTPKDKILIGTTRQIVLELCKQLNIECQECDIFTKDMSGFDEVFLTAANKEVLPVTKVDDVVVGNGQVGEVSRRLEAAYKQAIQEEINKS